MICRCMGSIARQPLAVATLLGPEKASLFHSWASGELGGFAAGFSVKAGPSNCGAGLSTPPELDYSDYRYRHGLNIQEPHAAEDLHVPVANDKHVTSSESKVMLQWHASTHAAHLEAWAMMAIC